MARFFLHPDAWKDNAALSGDEAFHCARVLRAKVGDRIEVFDGKGRSAEAHIDSVSKSRIELSLEHPHEASPAVPGVVLVQSVLKGKAMDWLIQKAVELGTSRIQPILTEHGVVRPGDAKPDKWRRVALEACKQCGQSFLPEVSEPLTLEEYLGQHVDGVRVVASLAEPRRALREVLADAGKAGVIHFAVGPEGDFSAGETQALLGAGFLPATLGSQVLRSETAALFGLAAISYAFA